MVYSPNAVSNYELEVNRKLTKWFIGLDPTDIVLTTKGTRIERPGGGYLNGPGVNRPEQRFKLISQSGASDGLTTTEDGKERKYDFILMGLYDAEIEIGDFWEDDLDGGHTFTVMGFIPNNGYEVKATILAFGKRPIGG